MEKRNYHFVDTIRCIAMIFIVAEHSFFLDGIKFQGYDIKFWTYISTIQLSKFGTISFFILAGFLLGDKFTDYTAGTYLKRRFSNTFGPWLLWSLVFLATEVIHDLVGFLRFGIKFNAAESVGYHLPIIYLFTNYWFIINFMICISLLLSFKKYLYSNIFGAILLLFSLFYSVNLYFVWIITSHTTAIFGFVFYLWLGVQMNKNWTWIDGWIRQAPYSLVIAAVPITFFAADLEIMWLMKIKSTDPYNTLRLSNILFSLAVFTLLLKVRDFKLIHYLKPRETTYGIYLIHYILVMRLLPEIFRPLRYDPNTFSLGQILVFQGARFVIVYFLTFGLVSLLKRSALRWTIGLKKPVTGPF